MFWLVVFEYERRNSNDMTVTRRSSSNTCYVFETIRSCWLYNIDTLSHGQLLLDSVSSKLNFILFRWNFISRKNVHSRKFHAHLPMLGVISWRVFLSLRLRRVWWYQRGNQNPYIEEEQTTQWSKDTKGVIRIRISKKNRQHNGQKIPKG